MANLLHGMGASRPLTEIPKPCIIGVSGGPASGKSHVCSEIIKKLRTLSDAVQGNDSSEAFEGTENISDRVVVIGVDSFYRKNHEMENGSTVNYDHPNAIDNERLVQTLDDLSAGKPVRIPKYDYLKGTHHDTTHDQIITKPDVVIVEGILLFYWEDIRNKFHMKIFAETDMESRLSNRIMRDVERYGRPLDQVLTQYESCVKPSFEAFGQPTKTYADVIIPRAESNKVACDLIADHISDILMGTAKSLQLPRQPVGVRDQPHRPH